MTRPLPRPTPSTARIFRWPIVVAVVSVVGLLSALIGDGPWDALSWLTLGGTVVLIVERLMR